MRLKQLAAILTAACLLPIAANALSVGDANYLGHIDDGIPSSPANEVGYINNLTTLAAGQGDTIIGTETYNREGSTLAGPFPTATTAGGGKDETGDNTITLPAGSFQYVLGKYDGPNEGSVVWFSASGFSGDIELPATVGGFELSHISWYNPVVSTPDGGATLALIGVGVLALGLIRRKLG